MTVAEPSLARPILPPDHGRVTQALNYAPAPDVPRFSAWRMFLWAVYYGCWSAGLLLPGFLVSFQIVNAVLHGDPLVQHTRQYGPIAGAATGLVLAYAFRGRRWPHAVPVVLGATMMAWVISILIRNQRYLSSQVGGLLAGLVLVGLVNGLTLWTAGAAGFLLNRRRRR